MLHLPAVADQIWAAVVAAAVAVAVESMSLYGGCTQTSLPEQVVVWQMVNCTPKRQLA